MPNVAIVGSVGLPAKYGGWETLVENLACNIPEDFKVTIYCSAYAYDKKPKNYKRAFLKYVKFKANGVSSIIYDGVSMLDALMDNDAILVLGVSGAIFFPFVRLFGCKIVVNIDGLEWKRGKWSLFARYYLKFSEIVACKFAHRVITDNLGLTDYVQRKYKINTSFIPYGADHVERCIDVHNREYFVTVCRIEPENSIDVILSAFSKSSMPYVIVGNWSYSDYGKALRKKYSSNKNITMLDPIYRRSEIDKIRSQSICYIHGHTVGGTNPSLVEAMYLGLDVLAYDCIYNRYTTNNFAQFFNSEESLINLLKSYSLDLSRQRKLNLTKYAEDVYKWEIICSKYYNEIRSVI